MYVLFAFLGSCIKNGQRAAFEAGLSLSTNSGISEDIFGCHNCPLKSKQYDNLLTLVLKTFFNINLLPTWLCHLATEPVETFFFILARIR